MIPNSTASEATKERLFKKSAGSLVFASLLMSTSRLESSNDDFPEDRLEALEERDENVSAARSQSFAAQDNSHDFNSVQA